MRAIKLKQILRANDTTGGVLKPVFVLDLAIVCAFLVVILAQQQPRA
jgi:hypothetical protein